ncbi:MAG: T9SS type A sorting domain-containing protein [Bacteroidetes bacterium]|nr:T9SS type A sorting domain-containing protein [Bacteroidota bacterium]
MVDISNAASQLSVFPNPTNGALNFNESLSGNIIVRNILGEVVWQMAGKDVQSLELSNLSAGSYLLQHLDANYNLSIVKFVISGNN